jgi:predicted ATP-binding protein involved in virulence
MKQRIRIAHLNLLNFRGFADLSVDFDNNLTVFIGNNGSGKTTILEAVAVCLQYVKEQVQDHAQKDIFTDSDIRIAKGVDTFDINLSFSEPSARLNASYIRRGRPSFNFIGISNDEPDYEIEATLKTWYRDNKSLEIIAYYPCQAITVENGQAVNFNVFNVENAYDDTLDGRFNFSMLNKWLIWQYSLRQEIGANVFFDHIVEAIIGQKGILNDADNRLFNDLRVTYANNPEGALLFVKEAAPLLAHQLSSGEKMLFALVADIGRRLVTANPNSQDPLKEGSGLVLIDEIDLHLHPSWQQKVVLKLIELFPKVQFVITSHSPAVISSLTPQHIRVLIPDEKTGQKRVIDAGKEHKHTKGLEPNRILKEIMGTTLRDAETQEKMTTLNQLLKTDYNNPKMLTLLTELTADLGKEDPFIMRMQHEIMMLKRKKQTLHEVH